MPGPAGSIGSEAGIEAAASSPALRGTSGAQEERANARVKPKAIEDRYGTALWPRRGIVLFELARCLYITKKVYFSISSRASPRG